MSHRRVQDVMTSKVVTVTEETPFKELAITMARHHVSALPVIGPDGRLAGLVSEADLLPKEEAKEDQAARRLPWWRRLAGRARARGRTARDVMSFPVITIAADVPVVEAARVMHRHHVKRLPVTAPGGRLTGIVSRCDLVSVFIRPDRDIGEEIRREVFGECLWTNPALVRVSVSEGVVTLEGQVEKKSMLAIAVRMSRSVDGVVAVVDRLTFETDDTRPQPPPGQERYEKPERPLPTEIPHISGTLSARAEAE